MKRFVWGAPQNVDNSFRRVSVETNFGFNESVQRANTKYSGTVGNQMPRGVLDSGKSPIENPKLQGSRTMRPDSELAVTLSAKLYARLCRLAKRLDVPLEWLVASLLLDSVDADAFELEAAQV